VRRIVIGWAVIAAACAPAQPAHPVAATVEPTLIDAGAAKASSTRVDICVAVIEHARRCDDSDEESDCPRQRECAAALLRPEAIALLPDCLRDHPCDESPRVCLADAGTQLSSNRAYASYGHACHQRRDVCGEELFDEDYCGPEMAPFRDEVLGFLATCLEEPCREIASCMKQAIRSAGCK
jgi:hypothetical protein